MPVAHLGLTVSYIPTATEFYLAALRPLGYQYIGHQGDSIGFGVHDADFFITQQSRRGERVTSAHIAFTADSRTTVRTCYAAALNAGGRPSGAPSYRDGDLNCFNAAVEDLDGNTIEFIHRERAESDENNARQSISNPRDDRMQLWRPDVRGSASKAPSRSQSSRPSQARSRAQTALDLASAVSKSTREPDAPKVGISRVHTAPATPTGDEGDRRHVGPKMTFGTVMGAAAGAALMYAMTATEDENARAEVKFNEYMRSRDRPQTLHDGRSSQSHRSHSVAGTRRPPPSRRAIEERTYYDDDEMRELCNRPASSRRPPPPQRSRTYDAVAYHAPSKTGPGSRHNVQRSLTMPLNDAPRHPETAFSRVSQQPSQCSGYDDSRLKRHDSGISVGSRRSRHAVDDKRSSARHSRRSSLQSDPATEMPLPSPRSRRSSYVSAAQVPIPESRNGGTWTDGDGYDSDGLSDLKTVVPDDSISCVDFSQPRRNASKRSDVSSAKTVRPAVRGDGRRSAMTLPVRSKRDEYYGQNGGRKSTYSYA